MSKRSLVSLGISLSPKGGAALVMNQDKILASAVGAKPASKKAAMVLPEEAVQFCLKKAGLGWSDIQVLGIQSRFAPDWADFISSQFGADRSWFESLWSLPGNFREELRFRNQLKEGLQDLRGQNNSLPNIVLSSDELAIAQGVYHQQNDPNAAVLIMTPPFSSSDTGLWVGEAGQLRQVWRCDFSNSLEHLVRNLAAYSGFRGRWGERQFLRLAEYGEPSLADQLRGELISWQENGELALHADRLVREPQHETDWAELRRILDAEPRRPEQPIGSRELDLARSVVSLLDSWYKDVLKHLQWNLKIKNVYIRSNGPVLERLKQTPRAESAQLLNLQMVSGQEESLLMAAGAAIQAWRGHTDQDWLHKNSRHKLEDHRVV